MNITVNGRTVEVNTLDTKAIIELYNQLAFELDETPVNRFANRSKAESRLVAIADRHAAMVRNREAAAPLTALQHHVTGAIERGEAEAITEVPVTLVQKRTADGASVLVNDSGTKLVSTGPDSFKLELSERDKALAADPVHVHQTITPSADGQSVTVDTQVTVQLDGTDKAQIKAEAAARAPVPAGAPRWAKPKHEAPSKIAYRPRPNSSQAVMYDLLTKPDGVLIEAFCETMKQFNDKTLHQPSTVWSCLRYLFVTSKGYGLNFDGQRLKLIVPQDERDAVKAATKKAA